MVLLQAGLMVGDMLLSVNNDDMVGADYDTATSRLRKTEGVINMWVANANRGKGKKLLPNKIITSINAYFNF